MKRLSKIFHRSKRESPRLPRDLTQDSILMRSDESDSDKDERNGRASIDLTDYGPTKSRSVSKSSAPAPLSAASSESQLDRDTTKKLRDELFNAMSNDDVEAVKSTIQNIEKHKLTLEKEELRDPINDLTVLHSALDQRKLRVASYLIESQSKSFLSASFVNISKQIPPSKKTVLHCAAEVGDNELMEKLLQKLSAGDDKLDFGDGWLRMSSDYKTEEVVIMMNFPIGKRRLSTIHIAAINNHSQLIPILLSSGFNVNCEDSDNETPLILAVRLGHLETIKELITNKANVDHANNYGSTALHHAVSQGRKDIVKLLLEEGKADLNIERIKSPKTPIEMAANRNEVKLVKALLRGNIELEYRHRALMIAATKGNLDIVKCLIESDTDKKLINRSDDNGSTALLEAASANYLPIVKYLVNESADLSWKNHARQTVFDIAMLNPNNSLLQFLLEIQRTKKRDPKKEAFYLHVAAANGDIKKIEYLLASGFDFYALDEHQNTFLHTAASHNKANVIEKFISPTDDIDTLRNSEGETPMHIAARRGYFDCVEQLIKNKSKLNLVDKNGHNPLHTALTSTTISIRVVAALIEAIKESYVGILNDQDMLGRTALHLAAAGKKPDILRLLLDLDPEIENKEGDTPLHVAAEFGSVEVLKTYLEEFCVRLKKGKIDHKDVNGFSALHRCVMVANAEKVELMLHHGADLSLTDESGKTVLHTMVDSYVDNPSFDDSLVEVYKTIVCNATKWYCWRNDMRMPKEESKEFYLTQMDAVRLLTSEMFSHGRNALQYASKKGADKLLKEILNTLNIYRFNKNRPMPLKGRGLDECADRGSVHKQQATKRWLLMILKKAEVIFDVTYLVPQLMPTREINVVGNVVSKDDQKEMSTSCLELIINQGNEDLALSFLKEVPFRSLVSNYWKLCRRTYEALMWIHVVFMVCFTSFVMPSYHWLHWRFGTNSSTVDPNDDSNNPSKTYAPPHLFGIFLLWPVFNLLYTCIYTLKTLFYLRCKKAVWKRILMKEKQKVGEITSGLLRFPIGVFLFVFDNLSLISSVGFGASFIAWYIMFLHADNAHRYLECLGMAFIFGWLHTISFVKGFKDWNAMAAILKQIILKDISRFIYIYIFILISFGYAIHAIIQADYHLNPDERLPTSTIYLTFYRMLSPGNVLDVSESDDFKTSGGRVAVLRAVCSAYSILSSVVLMNMLIAMMNGTYSDIKAEKSASWRIGSLRMALWIERHFPLRRLKLLRMKHTLYDATQNRWYMTYEPEDGEDWDPKEKPETERDSEDEEEDDDKPTPETTMLKSIQAEISGLREEIKAKNEENNELIKSINDLKTQFKQLHEICRETSQIARVIRPE